MILMILLLVNHLFCVFLKEIHPKQDTGGFCYLLTLCKQENNNNKEKKKNRTKRKFVLSQKQALLHVNCGYIHTHKHTKKY